MGFFHHSCRYILWGFCVETNHSCASSHYPDFTSSRSFTYSHSSRWSCRWFEYERILTRFRRSYKPIFLILKLFFLLGYLAIQLLGLSVDTIILPPFPSFFRRRQKMPIKRRYNDPAAAGGNNANLDITASRQTEKTATELCSFAIIWWSFLNLFGGERKDNKTSQKSRFAASSFSCRSTNSVRKPAFTPGFD